MKTAALFLMGALIIAGVFVWWFAWARWRSTARADNWGTTP